MNKRQLWSEADKARLVALWPTGKPIRIIAKLLGTSKNAATQQAHRMQLTPRPSPILSMPAPAVQAEARRLALAGHRACDIAKMAGVSPWFAKRAIAATRTPWPNAPEVPSLPVLPALPVLPELADHPPPWIDPPPPREMTPIARPAFTALCCWPLGDPGTKAFRYCDDRTQRGSPYCAPHHKTAYVKRPIEDAAA